MLWIKTTKTEDDYVLYCGEEWLGRIKIPHEEFDNKIMELIKKYIDFCKQSEEKYEELDIKITFHK